MNQWVAVPESPPGSHRLQGGSEDGRNTSSARHIKFGRRCLGQQAMFGPAMVVVLSHQRLGLHHLRPAPRSNSAVPRIVLDERGHSVVSCQHVSRQASEERGRRRLARRGARWLDSDTKIIRASLRSDALSRVKPFREPSVHLVYAPKLLGSRRAAAAVSRSLPPQAIAAREEVVKCQPTTSL